MKLIYAMMIIMFVTGCSTPPTPRERIYVAGWIVGPMGGINPYYGYRPYDPCIRCGETFVFGTHQGPVIKGNGP